MSTPNYKGKKKIIHFLSNVEARFLHTSFHHIYIFFSFTFGLFFHLFFRKQRTFELLDVQVNEIDQTLSASNLTQTSVVY